MKGRPSIRRTKLEMEAIFADVEEHLIRLRQDGRVAQVLIAKYNVDRSTVSKWIKQVFKRLRAQPDYDEAQQREDRRNLMRASLDTVASMALNKSVTVRDANGRPVMDMTDPAKPKPIKVSAPDLKNALDAFKQLRDLDGLDAPIKVETTSNGTTRTTLVLGDEDRKALEAALRGLG